MKSTPVEQPRPIATIVRSIVLAALISGGAYEACAALPKSDAPEVPIERFEIPLSPLDDPQPGEDLGSDARQASLGQVAASMRTAQQLLAMGDSTVPAQRVQQQIVHDLDALIEQLENQQKQKPGQKPGAKPKPGGQQKQASKSGQGPTSSKAAADSVDQPGGTAQGQVDMQEMRQLMNQVWGQLPERLRDGVPQSWTEQFLPKYELELEKYYRRLAEEPEPSGP